MIVACWAIAVAAVLTRRIAVIRKVFMVALAADSVGASGRRADRSARSSSLRADGKTLPRYGDSAVLPHSGDGSNLCVRNRVVAP